MWESIADIYILYYIYTYLDLRQIQDFGWRWQTSFLHNDTSLYIPLTNDDWRSFYIILYHPSSRGIPNKPPLFGWFIVYGIGFTTWKTWSTWSWWLFDTFWFQWFGFSCDDWSGMDGRSWFPTPSWVFHRPGTPLSLDASLWTTAMWMILGYIHLWYSWKASNLFVDQDLIHLDTIAIQKTIPDEQSQFTLHPLCLTGCWWQAFKEMPIYSQVWLSQCELPGEYWGIRIKEIRQPHIHFIWEVCWKQSLQRSLDWLKTCWFSRHWQFSRHDFYGSISLCRVAKVEAL